MKADLIVTGASALTMNPDIPTASAVAIADGRIVAVGADADVVAHAGPSTRIVDAKGATLLPGFVEAHRRPSCRVGTFWGQKPGSM